MTSNRGRHMVLTALFLLGPLFGAVSPASAGDPQTPRTPWTFTFHFENDLFSGTDRNYTNGVKLSLTSPDLRSYREGGSLPEWALPWVKRLPFINAPGLHRNIALSLGQHMYTPEDTDRATLIRDDRPYAGWTYGAIAFHSKGESRLDTIEIQAGIVGPHSYAEETQRLVHELRGIDVPAGWDNQLEDEPGLVFIYERKNRVLDRRRPAGPGVDAITHLGAALGNVFTYANAGLQLRAGWNLPADFGTALIRPAGHTGAPVSARGRRIRRKGAFSLYAFGAVSGRAVLHNIFLDGNTFTDSHSVDKEPLVADLSAGLSLVYGRYKVSYAQVLRTREFERQDERHTFGSITLSVSY